jgi:hypothetical protein
LVVSNPAIPNSGPANRPAIWRNLVISVAFSSVFARHGDGAGGVSDECLTLATPLTNKDGWW